MKGKNKVKLKEIDEKIKINDFCLIKTKLFLNIFFFHKTHQ